MLTPRVRVWIYGIATAALGVLAVYGVVDDQQAAAWSGLAAAVTMMAAINTPTRTTTATATIPPTPTPTSGTPPTDVY